MSGSLGRAPQRVSNVESVGANREEHSFRPVDAFVGILTLVVPDRRLGAHDRISRKLTCETPILRSFRVGLFAALVWWPCPLVSFLKDFSYSAVDGIDLGP